MPTKRGVRFCVAGLTAAILCAAAVDYVEDAPPPSAAAKAEPN